MPTLEHKKAIKLYHQKVADKYPGIPYEEFERMCMSPFEYVKVTMREGKLAQIHLKFFGKWMVLDRRLQKLIDRTKKYFELGYIEEQEFKNKMTYFTEYQQELNSPTQIILEDDTEGTEGQPAPSTDRTEAPE